MIKEFAFTCFLVLLFLIPEISVSQDSLLTLNQAIELALKNNYQVNIAFNTKEQAKKIRRNY